MPKASTIHPLMLALRPYLNAWGWDHPEKVLEAMKLHTPALVIPLSSDERAELFREDGAQTGGGFQNLIRKLRAQTTGSVLTLYLADLERIPRYAFDYRGGGWQLRLQAIFQRTLGPNLGRRTTHMPDPKNPDAQPQGEYRMAPIASDLPHTTNDLGECAHWCRACRENTLRGLNPDGTMPHEPQAAPSGRCCERDHDGDGNCDRHPGKLPQAEPEPPLFHLDLPSDARPGATDRILFTASALAQAAAMEKEGKIQGRIAQHNLELRGIVEAQAQRLDEIARILSDHPDAGRGNSKVHLALQLALHAPEQEEAEEEETKEEPGFDAMGGIPDVGDIEDHYRDGGDR